MKKRYIHIIVSSLLTLGILPVWATVELPVRVFSPDASPATATVSVNVPAEANPAETLYAQIHNLRFGGQVSVRVNAGAWTHLHNHTVTVLEPERSQGGIGAVSATIRVEVPLDSGVVVTGQSNTVSFRFNGTDGVVSGIRVIDFNFRDASSVNILPPSEFTDEDPGTWTPPGSLPSDITAGSNLWNNAALITDPINQVPINGKCASCHFEDGSDLKYFNYSSDAIITRSRFHGLTQQEGEQVASFIRSLTKPNPGRPWNPPFQPGPDLDPDPGDSLAVQQQKAEAWMAGAGIDWVVEDEADILEHVFPDGTSPAAIGKVMEHEGTFSVREIPIPIQFPDWNDWLPLMAPEDLWSNAFYYAEPYALYNTLRNTVDSEGGSALAADGDLNETFRKFKNDLENWYGTFRLPDEDLANDTAVSLARNPGLSREDVIKSLMRWMVIKMMEVTRDYDLEAVQDDPGAMAANGHPNFTPELLSIPGGENRSIVFGLAPHISGNVYLHFENQPEGRGKMESNQWYHLQLCINSGYRMQVNMNVPLDWAYQIIHLESAGKRAGRAYGFQRLITQIKMLQMRETGKGVMQGGFSQRTLNPCFFYSDPDRDRSHLKGVLDDVEPGLWAKVFEEYFYEWLDVMEGHDLSTMPRDDSDRHQIETSTYVPVPWPGGGGKYFDRPGEVHADALYRLLPLLPADGIDEMLLIDVREWCKKAWPYNAGTWGSVPDWDSLFTPANLYAENFEDDVASTNALDFPALTVTAIKGTNYVNNGAIGIANGGGVHVAHRGLTGGGTNATVRQGINSLLVVPLNGATNLTVKARVAFRDHDSVDPGLIKFKMRVQVDSSGGTFDTVDVITLDPDLYDQEFESFVSTVTVPAGATNITWLSAWWERVGGTGGGTVYIDNIHMLPVDDTVDTTPPSAPVLDKVTSPADLRLKCSWNANPPSEGVVGYNVYRRVNGDPASAAVKLNLGLVDNPYIEYEDFTVDREVNYRYYITAVDAAGNESMPSNEDTKTLDDIDTPRAPSTIWAGGHAGAVRLNWFGVRDWDVAEFNVYRKAEGESGFTQLTSGLTPAEAVIYDDSTALPGIDYDYYVEAVDLAGNTSPTSSLASVQVAHLDAWRYAFEGVNGWDSDDPEIAGESADFDNDGVPTIWEYLQGGNPAVADPVPGGATTRLALDETGGDTYLEVSYLRDEDLPPGLIVTVQFSDDLVSWTEAYVVEGDVASSGFSVHIGDAAGGTRLVTVRLDAPISTSSQFARFGVQGN